MNALLQEIEVDSDGDGSLIVRWQLEGEDAVHVAVGATAAADEHRRLFRVEAGTTSTRLEDLGPGRHYVSVACCSGGDPVVCAERRLVFEGPSNFRDLGGYRASSGKRLGWGRVFRSDGLHQMTEPDRASFVGLGVRAVYDLREERERLANPDPVESIAIDVLQLSGDAASFASWRTEHDVERVLRDTYVAMLERSAPRFGELLTRLSSADQLPAVFHCHAGKDRTGLAAALLLSALGVEREVILDDFVLTARWRSVEADRSLLQFLAAAGVPDGIALALLGAPRWAMAETLDVLNATYGGIAAYLLGPAGMEKTVLEDLRGALLEEPV